MPNQKWNILVFALAMIAGLALALRSWDGLVYVYVEEGDERSPAAVSKVMDLSELEGAALSLATQKRLVSEAQILLRNDKIGLELGHFVARGPSGKRRFACHLYDKIELKFIAEGVAENGEQPFMLVEADCKIGASVTKISPIWIPVKRLSQEKPGNMELKISEPQPMLFRFDHIGSQWPQRWLLQRLILKSENTGRRLEISRKDIKKFSPKPLRLEWTLDRSTASEHPSR